MIGVEGHRVKLLKKKGGKASCTGAVISIEGTCEGDMGQQCSKALLERKREIAHGKHMQRNWFCSVALINESM